MTEDQFLNLLTVVTLFEMTIAMGLELRFSEIAGVARDWKLMLRALLANFVLQPAAVITTLMLLRPSSFSATALLLLAACPAAHYAMPFTKIAKGRLASATGLLVVLAASTVVLAPVVLLTLPLFSSGDSVHVPAGHVITTLLAIVLVPLALGIGLREWKPIFADRLLKPATSLSVVLNLAMIATILVVQGHQLSHIRAQGWVAMAVLAVVSLLIGWLLGGPDSGNRKALAQNTVLRNMGPGLVIATSAFPALPVAPVILAATLVNGAVGFLAALWWGRHTTVEGSGAAPAGS